jgi:hypothetical protein
VSGELVPGALAGARIGKKAPESPTAPEPGTPVTDPTTVPPLVPLLVTNSGEVALHTLLGGPDAIEAVHRELIRQSHEWAASLGRELSHINIKWEVTLEAIATTPVLVMPDQSGG